MPVILALRAVAGRQQVQASLGYTERPFAKTKGKNK